VVGWQWHEWMQNDSAVILVVKSWPGWQWQWSCGEEQWLVAVVTVAVVSGSCDSGSRPFL
jgi:hypothetical protein